MSLRSDPQNYLNVHAYIALMGVPTYILSTQEVSGSKRIWNSGSHNKFEASLDYVQSSSLWDSTLSQKNNVKGT